MDQDDIAFLKSREARRQTMSAKERHVEALEDIADALYALVPAMQRLVGSRTRR